jgi:murein DD-endopeptidase MepM/ murein hydrolase activator NlpD
MSVLGHALQGARSARNAKLGLAVGAVAVVLPLIGATNAHAAEASPRVATVAAVAAAPTPATTASGDVAPLASLRITEPYGVPGPWAAGYHTGVDLGAAAGTSVRSVGDGTVVRSGWDGAYGIDVLMKLNDGKYALYGHLSQTTAFAGEHVTAGQEIGRSGATGHVTGPHLHFEVRTTPFYGSDVNPVTYLQTHGVAI